MAKVIGSAERPLRVAVVGSGPAGYYAVEELLRHQEPRVSVDLIDRLPTPYGLVRGGVAPDHQKIKSVIRIFERTSARPAFRYLGNVTFGRDLLLEDLLKFHDQVLFCTGAETDRQMGIPGEQLRGSHPATEFVGWYNGHPDYTHHAFDLSAERVAVIGNGNVAMDVVRILARPIAELAITDIADYALEALRASKVREIYLLGRRGPAQAAFTNPEIRELTRIPGVDLIIRPQDLELDEASRAFLEVQKDPVYRRNVEILTQHASTRATQADAKAKDQAKDQVAQPRKIHARFLVSPREILGTDKVQGLRLETNRLEADASGNPRARGTGSIEELPVELVFRSIGYRGLPLPGLPFDERGGTIPNRAGRILDPATGNPLPRLYTAGWIKRGPSGVIGTNKADAIESVRCMLEDVPMLATGAPEPDPQAVTQALAQRGVRWVDFEDWKQIDEAEIACGKPQGRPRVKFTAIDGMLAVLDG